MITHIFKRPAFLVSLACFLFFRPCLALEYDHLGSKSSSQNFDVQAGPTEYITLNVNNTCKDTTIEVMGLEPAPELVNNEQIEDPLAVSEQFEKPIASCTKVLEEVKQLMEKFVEEKHACLVVPTKSFKIPNDSEYTGFIVNLDIAKENNITAGITGNEFSAIAEASADRCEKALDILIATSGEKIKKNLPINNKQEKAKYSALHDDVLMFTKMGLSALKTIPIRDTKLVINTNVKGWTTEFSGGILVSSLTDKEFRIDESNSEVRLIRNTSAEDEQRLELGAFTHVYHSNWRDIVFDAGTPAITAGISVNSGDSLDYFIGGSLKFGNAYLNLGWQWGQVKTGPTNLLENTPLSIDASSANAALAAGSSNSRTERGVFLSISFTFAGQGASPIKTKLAFPNPVQPEPPPN